MYDFIAPFNECNVKSFHLNYLEVQSGKATLFTETCKDIIGKKVYKFYVLYFYTVLFC